MIFYPAENMTTEDEVMKLRKENRTLRIDNKRLILAHSAQKKKRDILEELLRERDEHIRLLEIQRDEIGKLIEELKRQRNMYRDMTFKKNKNLELQESKDKSYPSNINLKNRKHVGGQPGHVGHGRTSPDKGKVDTTQ